MSIKIFNKKEKEELLKKLEQQFGIKKIDGLVVQIGQERLFLYQGSLSEDEIKDLEKIIPIERVGVYFAKIQEDKIRLSIEGTHLFKDQIKKNIFEIDEVQAEEWMHGSELNVQTGQREFVVMKCREDFLGTGKASNEKITNFIPKSRRLKFKDKKF